jgi:protein TonB
MKGERVPGLVELAFKGRNKEYGAYDLRRKYLRYLLVSLVTGLLILTATVMTPFLVYYLEPVELVEMPFMYDVEYDVMLIPQDDDLGKVARDLAHPKQEVAQIPVVTDSVQPQKDVPVTPDPLSETEKDEKAADSAAAGRGHEGSGLAPGDETGIATTIDVYPRYPGGEDSRLFFLRKNVRYPEAAIRKGIQGIVMVVITLEVDGTVSNAEVSQGIGGGCDEEAVRVVKLMPRWEPAKRKGRPVRVMVRMPIVFRIPGK